MSRRRPFLPSARPLRIALVAVVGLSLTGLRARAEEEETPATPVVVVPFAPLFGDLSQAKADKATEFVKNELGAASQFRVVESVDPKANKGGRSWEEDLANAATGVKEALDLFEKGAELARAKKPKLAAESYERGIQQFLVNFQGAEDFRPLADAYVQLAIARFKLGNEDEAVKLLDDVVRVDPARVLQPPEVVNLFAKLHDKARKAYLEKARGQMKVTSTPAGAQVFLDGREIGETPLLGKGIVPGDHYLKVIKPGQGALWRRVNISSSEVTEVRAELTGGTGSLVAGVGASLSANRIDPKLSRDVRKIGEGAKAEFVLFGAMRKGEDTLDLRSYALQVRTGKVAMIAPVSFDSELLNAGIEVFKLTSDFGEKARAFDGITIDSETPVWTDASAPGEGDDALNTVVVTSPGGEAIAQGGSSASSDDSSSSPAPAGERRGRRAIASSTAAADAPRAVASSDGSESGKPRLRARGRIGEAPPEPPKPAAREEAVDDEPRIARRTTTDSRKSVLDDVVAEEEKPKAKARAREESVDESGYTRIEARKSSAPSFSALSPEELRRLQEVEKKDSGLSTGQILLWTSVGVVGAAGIAALGYFLFVPSEPQSATVTVRW